MKIALILLILAAVLIAGVFLYQRSQATLLDTTADIIGGADGPTAIFVTGDKNADGYRNITMDEAKIIFEAPGDYAIVDVRRPDEFATGHIPGAVNIPNEDISDTEPAVLPEKARLIFVYCRSGNRSKQASAKLAAMGYTNIVEFGGILDWTGEIVTD